MGKAARYAELCIGSLGLVCSVASAQKFQIAPEMQKTLSEELSKPAVVYVLDSEAARRIDEAFEAWVSTKMDLKAAQRTESEAFPGTATYSLRLPPSSAASGKVAAAPSAASSAQQNGQETSFFYTRGPNQYSFRKIADVPAQGKLEQQEATDMAKSFLLQNAFVQSSAADDFTGVVVRELRDDSQSQEDGKVIDALLLQSVRFRRKFMNVPVINSVVSVDFNPDTREMLAFKHHNWTPTTMQPMLIQASETNRSPEDVVQELTDQVKLRCGPYDTVELRQVIRGWLQTDTEMIPILICNLQFPHGDHYDGFTHVADVITGEAKDSPRYVGPYPRLPGRNRR